MEQRVAFDIREYKRSLRDKYKSFRRDMDSNGKAELDRAVFEKLTASSLYREARSLLTYVSTPIEVDTQMLIQKALSDGKQVGVPRCIDGTRDMLFYQITSFGQLEPGTFSVLEPKPDLCRQWIFRPGTLCIVPGLAFDTLGYRLGYGKGYYDRFLNSAPEMTKVGICYCACTLNQLNHGKFDIPVDYLVTEKYIRAIGGRNGKKSG